MGNNCKSLIVRKVRFAAITVNRNFIVLSVIILFSRFYAKVTLGVLNVPLIRLTQP